MVLEKTPANEIVTVLGDGESAESSSRDNGAAD
jgi:hypothetical protein